jgi:acetyl-CoA synthetase
MIPEAFFSIFACSKIGAIYTTIFSGLGSQALHSRLRDSNSKVLITANKMRRRCRHVNLKDQWIEAVKNTNISRIIVIDEDNGDDYCNNRIINNYKSW